MAMEPLGQQYKFDASKYPTYKANLHLSQVNFNKEQLRLCKEEKKLEREHRRNSRKYDAARQGVYSMLGQTFYPDCDKDHTLFQHNAPGFCYGSDGKPRYFKTLAESKTRKIVHDLDGKNGLFMNIATNVVSDSPVLTEILSCPDLKALLCDLRTTAALLEDRDLFSQFSMSLLQNPNNPIPMRGGNSRDCLIAYRRHLIQQLFHLLKQEISHRTSSNPCPSDVDSRLLLKISGTETAFNFHHYDPPEPPGSAKKNATENSEIRITGTQRPEPPTTSVSAFLLEPGRYRTLKESLPISTIKILPPDTPSSTSAVSTSQSSKIARGRNRFPDSLKKNETNQFIKALLKDVENIVEIVRTMGRLQRKRPRCDTLIDPLFRLLKYETLLPHPLAKHISSTMLQASTSKKAVLQVSNQNSVHKKTSKSSLNEPTEQINVKSRSTMGSVTLSATRDKTLVPNIDCQKSSTNVRLVHHERQFLEKRDEITEVQELSGAMDIKITDSTDSKTDCGSESSRSLQINAPNGFQNKNLRNLKTPDVAQKSGKVSNLREESRRRISSAVSSKRIAFTKTYVPKSSSSVSRNSFNSVPNFCGYKLLSQTSSTNKATLFLELSAFVQKSQTHVSRGTSEKSVSAGSRLECRRVFGNASPTSNGSNFYRALDTCKWTLRVDTSDLIKLRHELEDGTIRQRVSEFESSCFV